MPNAGRHFRRRRAMSQSQQDLNCSKTSFRLRLNRHQTPSYRRIRASVFSPFRDFDESAAMDGKPFLPLNGLLKTEQFFRRLNCVFPFAEQAFLCREEQAKPYSAKDTR